MSSKFSGALQITDLDDFITPSQECIKPIEIKKNRSGTPTGAKITIQVDGGYQLTDNKGYAQKLEKVQVTLNDCLACSGCITSAEGVLIGQQNHEEFLKQLSENKKHQEDAEHVKVFVVSLSVQSILSLSEVYGISPDDVVGHLVTLFKNLGVDKVIEITVAEDLAILETQHEFVERFRTQNGDKPKLPMLASACPGWICYAEKTHGSFILPYISTTKSPQQIIGSLVKTNLGVPSEKIYHVTLMPCYDKKLEASRNEFFKVELNAKDVDCVITTVELQQLISEQGIELSALPRTPLDYPWGRGFQTGLVGHAGSGSGGYAHHLLVHAARELFGIEVNDMNWKSVRNPDFLEMTVERDSEVILRFAIANGFRNIQNIVQKIKRGKSNYHYVEIMACPSGCLNGGAQARPIDGRHPKDLVYKLEQQYKNLPQILPEDNSLVFKLYREWLHGPGSDKCSALLHTSYHQVEKMKTALNIKW